MTDRQPEKREPSGRPTVPVWASLLTVALLALAFMMFGWLMRGCTVEDNVGPLPVVEAPDAGVVTEPSPGAGRTDEPVGSEPSQDVSGDAPLDVSDPAAVVARGDELFERGAYEGALEAYEMALSTNPVGVEALYGKGRTLLALGSVAEGEKALWTALDTQPGYVEAAVALCEHYVATGKYRSAVVTGRDVLEKVPSQSDIEYWVGAGYEGLGNVSAAMQWYRAAVADGGGHSLASQALSRLGG